MTEGRLRKRLETLARLTDNASVELMGVWFGDDTAAERQASDDVKSGRLAWQSAHAEALEGMRSLGDGNIKQAEEHRWISESFVFEVLEKVLLPGQRDKEALKRPAKRRGRPRKNS